MTTEILYWLSGIIPLVIVPIVLPMVVLLARRKRLTDAPNARKKQLRPVAVMGGTVIVLAMSITGIVVNLFYDISILFPAFSMMMILYIFGMLDDTIGLSWRFKMFLQLFAIILLYYGGGYGVNSLYGLFGLNALPWWISLLLTIFIGLLLLNAVNFSDGIDGLASGLGLLAAIVLGYWNIRHSLTPQALLSFAMVGVLTAFYAFNVFSERYKMYMGDSGSLVLGLYIYMSACPNSYYLMDNSFLADGYFISFNIALLSAMIFDMVRVVIMRIQKRKSPFRPDRTHLHHVYVDLGMSHFLATTKIIINNIAVIVVWYATAHFGMNVELQFFVVLLAGIVFIWMPYFILAYCRDKHRNVYAVISKRCRRRSDRLQIFSNLITRIIDGRYRNIIIHERE